MTWFQSIVLLISHFLGKIQYADFKMKHCIFLRGQIVRQEIWAKRWHPFKNFVRRDPTCYIAPGIRFDSLSFFNKSVGGGRKWKRGPVLLRVLTRLPRHPSHVWVIWFSNQSIHLTLIWPIDRIHKSKTDDEITPTSHGSRVTATHCVS